MNKRCTGLLSKRYINLKRVVKENPEFKELFEKYEIKTLSDLSDAVEAGYFEINSNKKLIDVYESMSDKTNLKLEDISTESLHVDKNTEEFLTSNKIHNFKQLLQLLTDEQKDSLDKTTYKFLMGAVKCIVTNLEEAKNKKDQENYER